MANYICRSLVLLWEQTLLTNMWLSNDGIPRESLKVQNEFDTTFKIYVKPE